MSTRSGKTTQRRIVKTHKGFSIIKVKVIEWWKSQFSSGYSNIPNKVEVYYDFCKEGDETKPSQAYECNAKNIAECQECIDNFIKDDCLYYTAAERNKYIYNPNRKNGWGFSYDDLIKLMNAHKKADKRIKRLYEDRLEDANFHSYCGYLADERYDDYIALARKEYQTEFKISIDRLADKEIELVNDGIADAITAYLKRVGIKNAGVEVGLLK